MADLGRDYTLWLGQVGHSIQDVRRRLWWANKDGEALDVAARAFIRGDPYLIGSRRPNDGGDWEAFFERLIDPDDEIGALDGLARLFGCFLDGHRAALNYLACAVAQLAIDEDPSLADPMLDWNQQLHPSAVEFPIFNKQAKYESSNKIRKLPEEFRTMFEGFQPFKADRQGLFGFFKN
jgi:hypothetical protein